MVTITINGKAIAVDEGTTILKAAESAGMPIPHLCYLEGINEIGACRMCVVEVEGKDRLVPACNNAVENGMVIHTNSPRVREARRTNMLLILSQHDTSCTTCIRSGNCELQTMAADLNVHYQPYDLRPERSRVDLSTPIIQTSAGSASATELSFTLTQTDTFKLTAGDTVNIYLDWLTMDMIRGRSVVATCRVFETGRDEVM